MKKSIKAPVGVCLRRRATPFAIALCALFANATTTYALEISAGVGALEEGDDRGRGAAILAIGFANDWDSKIYAWGRSYGPVTETDGMITVAKSFGMSGSKSFRSSVGGSVLMEQTSVAYHDAPGESTSFTSTNAGLMLGLSYDLYSVKSMTVTASWDAHLFPAGQGILLLVTGRKQVIGVTAGIAF